MDTFNSRLDRRLIKRAKALGRLTSLLRAHLPPECDGHFHVANVRDRTIAIMTDSPVWTTRLRQLGPKILKALQDSDQKNVLHVRVFSRPSQTPGVTRKQAKKPQPKRISSKSSQLIHQAAECIDDEALRHALHQLASHSTPDKPENS